MLKATSKDIGQNRLSSVVTTSLLGLIVAFLSLLVHQESTASPSQNGFFGELERVVVGAYSESLKLPRNTDQDGNEPDEQSDFHFWLAETRVTLHLHDPVNDAAIAQVENFSLPPGYSFFTPPLRAPPIA